MKLSSSLVRRRSKPQHAALPRGTDDGDRPSPASSKGCDKRSKKPPSGPTFQGPPIAAEGISGALFTFNLVRSLKTELWNSLPELLQSTLLLEFKSSGSPLRSTHTRTNVL